MTDSEKQRGSIDVSPTKDLFITMLVKDIDLIDAIVDMVDNCVDGARRIRGKEDYEGLWVRIDFAEDHFTIDDNCGGIPVDVARRYAFKFGRPEGAEPTPHSVGRFGIGMKRALFKLGRQFSIKSTAESSHFSLNVDVDDWKQEEDWTFQFTTWDEGEREYPSDQWGTKITVEHPYEGIANDFRLNNFENRLATELETKHQDNIEKSLAISLNGVPLEYRPAELLESDQLQPGYWETVFEDSGAPVSVKLYAGISESMPATAAGWYVFCNGRLILEADRSAHTGWGESNGTKIPQYHGEFARFRGYAYFDSDDPTLLP